MTNMALPVQSQRLLTRHLAECQNLGLILDKFAPWMLDNRGNWDLGMKQSFRRRGQTEVRDVSGGEAKGLWLSTTRQAKRGETSTVFEAERVDPDLMRAYQDRWTTMIESEKGLAFSLQTNARLVAGLGASHVLETALTLDRNTGLPYLPGSTVKGLARTWGLIEVASQVGIQLLPDVESKDQPLNKLAEKLISEPDETLMTEVEKLGTLSEDAQVFIQWFRFVFGSQSNAGGIDFMDAIYYGRKAPVYAADVMTPHYVNYYTENGSKPAAEDDSPNPVSFITVDERNTFAFGLIPRRTAFPNLEDIDTAIGAARDWLGNGLTQLGIGSKTAAGYGFFRRKSFQQIYPKEE